MRKKYRPQTHAALGEVVGVFKGKIGNSLAERARTLTPQTEKEFAVAGSLALIDRGPLGSGALFLFVVKFVTVAFISVPFAVARAALGKDVLVLHEGGVDLLKRKHGRLESFATLAYTRIERTHSRLTGIDFLVKPDLDVPDSGYTEYFFRTFLPAEAEKITKRLYDLDARLTAAEAAEYNNSDVAAFEQSETR